MASIGSIDLNVSLISDFIDNILSLISGITGELSAEASTFGQIIMVLVLLGLVKKLLNVGLSGLFKSFTDFMKNLTKM